MSMWLKPLTLERGLRIGTATSLYNGRNIPPWVGFLIWSGWLMRRIMLDNTRVFMAILLPTRMCSSAICGLGALLGATGQLGDSISWNEFIGLAIGTKVYLHHPNDLVTKKDAHLEGLVGECKTIHGQIAREIQIDSHNRRFKDSKLHIFESAFDEYRIALGPHPDRYETEDFRRVSNFFKRVKPDFKNTWMHRRTTECLIMTNQANWQRETDGVFIGAEGDHEHELSLSRLLMASNDYNAIHSKVLLSSPRATPSSLQGIPVTILDGPDALKCWERATSPNVIILLDRPEYDEGSAGILDLFSSVRGDQRLPYSEGVPGSPPPGIEMEIFAISTSR